MGFFHAQAGILCYWREGVDAEVLLLRHGWRSFLSLRDPADAAGPPGGFAAESRLE